MKRVLSFLPGSCLQALLLGQKSVLPFGNGGSRATESVSHSEGPPSPVELVAYVQIDPSCLDRHSAK